MRAWQAPNSDFSRPSASRYAIAEGPRGRTCLNSRLPADVTKLNALREGPLRCHWRKNKATHFLTRAGLSTIETREAVSQLLDAVKGTAGGIHTSSEQKQRIFAAIAKLEEGGRTQKPLQGPIDATWRLIWTTEKETLFILKNAKVFRTEAGEVFQVIDTAERSLQNVITFRNGASFVVDSSLEKGDGDKRLVFKFLAARLNLPKRSWSLPPFGKGWFDTVYLDDDIRVAKDIRGDTLVVQRDGPPRRF